MSHPRPVHQLPPLSRVYCGSVPLGGSRWHRSSLAITHTAPDPSHCNIGSRRRYVCCPSGCATKHVSSALFTTWIYPSPPSAYDMPSLNRSDYRYGSHRFKLSQMELLSSRSSFADDTTVKIPSTSPGATRLKKRTGHSKTGHDATSHLTAGLKRYVVLCSSSMEGGS